MINFDKFISISIMWQEAIFMNKVTLIKHFDCGTINWRYLLNKCFRIFVWRKSSKAFLISSYRTQSRNNQRRKINFRLPASQNKTNREINRESTCSAALINSNKIFRITQSYLIDALSPRPRQCLSLLMLAICWPLKINL